MSRPEVPFPFSVQPGFNDTPGLLPRFPAVLNGPQGRVTSPAIFPLPELHAVPHEDGMAPGIGYKAALGRATYKAHRVGNMLTIEASGTLGYAAQIADIRQSGHMIFPPQFEFIVYTPDGVMSTVTRNFSFSESFGFPETADLVVIIDADGRHAVAIEAAPEAVAAFAAVTAGEIAIGYGNSLQESFDNAVSQLPSHGSAADGFLTYTIESSGLMAGGFAGVHKYFTKVSFSESSMTGDKNVAG